MNALRRWAAGLAAAGLTLTAGCSGAGSLGASEDQVTIAMVSNSQMTDARQLSAEFEKDNPGTKLRFITLSENQARAKITMSTAMGGSEFDVVMISNYETPQWAKDGWLVNLSDYMAATPGYDEDDFIPSLRESLSYEGDMYAVPFYGESSFLMYRKDLFEQAGIAVDPSPDYQPTWQEVAGWADTLKTPNRAGICLRGKPGWGEVLAPLDTVINTFGGRWFDENWNAQLTSPEVRKAVNFYVDLVNRSGELGAAATGFQECANLFGQGQTAMWYDATSAVSVLEDPKEYPDLVGKIGYLPAPIVEKPDSGWLYTWALGIPKAAKNPDGAWKFISWMTSKDYMKLVGEKLGWARVPPGSRVSTYTELPEYEKISQSYGPLTLRSIENATPNEPTVQPVPYTGIQFVGIPEFQDLGTRVSQQISAAIAGQKSVDDALEQAQQYAEVVGRTYQEK
ncbi:sugar ABC transporter periplasmic protein [Mycolicibacterium phlei]|uniref:Sugar ABC transporter substrate-binding protein n=1 Tax=Mycolicibacterium phlei DSM 43239 = CCUG 21000 TaxID=1226750 RepID=A0A5N5UVC6_MYCPH|nr:sugar ABC transporter substrate-binding protein [Mycolicibacterium phlei]VEG07846.1 sugar ABC transporter periplasmic protein [Mycobacteroides chelonae]AMO59718.1 putative ABC transporter-binding protein precursor [Mycolicibacterium phlei]EID10648.1 sugar ABC transporter periplasmic protein [Mycolicibacterium phlei RIVM601174]KAB7753536.1 sugar ABC transporter substrate-binding protein [Mycolicibacterium phlei DSM 43239 = CCUG 21000]KXW62439.1 sugar ABC transporter substrate-binding protein